MNQWIRTRIRRTNADLKSCAYPRRPRTHLIQNRTEENQNASVILK